MSAVTAITVRLPLTIRKRDERRIVVVPDGSVIPGATRQAVTPSDPALPRALVRALRWRRMLETGAVATIREIAATDKINESYVSRVRRLTLLAPEMVEAILDARQPVEVTLPGQMGPFPVEWRRQRTGLIGA